MPLTVYPSANNPRITTNMWIFFQGAWRTVSEAFIRTGGSWKSFYKNSVEINIWDSQNTISLRNIYNERFPDKRDNPPGRAIFNIKPGVIIGGAPAISTGSWPSYTEVILNVEPGAEVIGQGGAFGHFQGTGGNGWSAISLQNALTVNNQGLVAGGGGGSCQNTQTNLCCVNQFAGRFTWPAWIGNGAGVPFSGHGATRYGASEISYHVFPRTGWYGWGSPLSNSSNSGVGYWYNRDCCTGVGCTISPSLLVMGGCWLGIGRSFWSSSAVTFWNCRYGWSGSYGLAGCAIQTNGYALKANVIQGNPAILSLGTTYAGFYTNPDYDNASLECYHSPGPYTRCGALSESQRYRGTGPNRRTTSYPAGQFIGWIATSIR